ncbi:MAG: tetratricopeptide repeat protein [Alistipes sp.]
MKRYFLLLVFVSTSLLLQAQTAVDSTAATQPVQSVHPTIDTASNEALWEAANTAYINANYVDAIAHYNQILRHGSFSAKLHYNLANAYFKQNRLGAAILHYNRALRLAPGDDDIRYNLSVAESRTKDNINAVPEFILITWVRALRNTMSGTAWTFVSLTALTGMLILVLFYLLSQRLKLRKVGFYGTLILLIVFIGATSFAASERNEAVKGDLSIVMASAAAVKSSPDKSATDIFVLHEGTKVRIVNTLGDWSEIMIVDGKKGWLENKTIKTI